MGGGTRRVGGRDSGSADVAWIGGLHGEESNIETGCFFVAMKAIRKRNVGALQGRQR